MNKWHWVKIALNVRVSTRSVARPELGSAQPIFHQVGTVVTSGHTEDSLKSLQIEMLRLAGWSCLSYHRGIRNMEYIAKAQYGPLARNLRIRSHVPISPLVLGTWTHLWILNSSSIKWRPRGSSSLLSHEFTLWIHLLDPSLRGNLLL